MSRREIHLLTEESLGGLRKADWRRRAYQYAREADYEARRPSLWDQVKVSRSDVDRFNRAQGERDKEKARADKAEAEVKALKDKVRDLEWELEDVKVDLRDTTALLIHEVGERAYAKVNQADAEEVYTLAGDSEIRTAWDDTEGQYTWRLAPKADFKNPAGPQPWDLTDKDNTDD